MFGILGSTRFLHKNLLLCYLYKRGKQYLAITIVTHTKKAKNTKKRTHKIKTIDTIKTYNKQILPSRKNLVTALPDYVTHRIFQGDDKFSFTQPIHCVDNIFGRYHYESIENPVFYVNNFLPYDWLCPSDGFCLW